MYAQNSETRQPPDIVVMYRDGVGEGQEQHVKNSEVAAIKVPTMLLFAPYLIYSLAYS